MHKEKIQCGGMAMLVCLQHSVLKTSCALSDLNLEQLNRVSYHFTNEES